MVERRVEAGGSWTRVDFVEGAGTTTDARTYRVTDTDVPFEAEQVRYRLRQRDRDGATVRSAPVTARLSGPTKAQLHVPFPNPSRRWTTLRYEIPEPLQGRPVRIAAYDVLGRRVRTFVSGTAQVGRQQHRAALDGLPGGLYFLRMHVGDTVQTRRFTVVR